MDLKHKIGPLPVWAWGLILGVVGYFAYERYSAGSSSSSGTASTTGILDPNAVDPNTGLTYGQEEAAAENANAAADSGAGSGGGTAVSPTDSGLGTSVYDAATDSDLQSILAQLQASAQSALSTPSAAAPTPVQGSSPPTTTASAHTTSTIDTHPGGPFYKWYMQVFGKAPPAHVPSNGAAYTLWKQGVSVASAKTITDGNKAASTAVKAATNVAKAVKPTKPKPKPQPKKGVKVKGP